MFDCTCGTRYVRINQSVQIWFGTIQNIVGYGTHHELINRSKYGLERFRYVRGGRMFDCTCGTRYVRINQSVQIWFGTIQNIVGYGTHHELINRSKYGLERFRYRRIW